MFKWQLLKGWWCSCEVDKRNDNIKFRFRTTALSNYWSFEDGDHVLRSHDFFFWHVTLFICLWVLVSESVLSVCPLCSVVLPSIATASQFHQ